MGDIDTFAGFGCAGSQSSHLTDSAPLVIALSLALRCSHCQLRSTLHNGHLKWLNKDDRHSFLLDQWHPQSRLRADASTKATCWRMLHEALGCGNMITWSAPSWSSSAVQYGVPVRCGRTAPDIDPAQPLRCCVLWIRTLLQTTFCINHLEPLMVQAANAACCIVSSLPIQNLHQHNFCCRYLWPVLHNWSCVTGPTWGMTVRAAKWLVGALVVEKVAVKPHGTWALGLTARDHCPHVGGWSLSIFWSQNEYHYG